MNDFSPHDVVNIATPEFSGALTSEAFGMGRRGLRYGLRCGLPYGLRRSAGVMLLMLVGLLLLVLPGCGAKDEAGSLEIFRQRWFDAVNEQEGEALYTMLDAASKRWVSRELDELRGLDKQSQQRVVDQLGGQRADNLLEFTPGKYFGLLWRQATEGRRPTMKIEAAGAQMAYITLSLNDADPQRIRLTIEGGHWVWQLPEAEFSVRAKATRSSHEL